MAVAVQREPQVLRSQTTGHGRLPRRARGLADQARRSFGGSDHSRGLGHVAAAVCGDSSASHCTALHCPGRLARSSAPAARFVVSHFLNISTAFVVLPAPSSSFECRVTSFDDAGRARHRDQVANGHIAHATAVQLRSIMRWLALFTGTAVSLRSSLVTPARRCRAVFVFVTVYYSPPLQRVHRGARTDQRAHHGARIAVEQEREHARCGGDRDKDGDSVARAWAWARAVRVPRGARARPRTFEGASVRLRTSA